MIRYIFIYTKQYILSCYVVIVSGHTADGCQQNVSLWFLSLVVFACVFHCLKIAYFSLLIFHSITISSDSQYMLYENQKCLGRQVKQKHI